MSRQPHRCVSPARLASLLAATAATAAIGGGAGTALAQVDVEAVALTLQPAPGAGGAVFRDFRVDSNNPGPSLVINDGGSVAFFAVTGINDPQPSATGQGIWSGTAGSLASVARSGEQAPGAGGSVYSYFSPAPAITNAGTVAFRAELLTPQGQAGGDGIWAGRPGDVSKQFRSGEAVPGGGGATFANFGDFSFNGTGRLAFLANVGGSPGVYEGQAADVRPVARRGQGAPGTESDTTFLVFTRPVLNSAGRVAFFGQLLGPDFGSETRKGYWAEGPAGLAKVARGGDPAPGGLTYGDFIVESIRLNDAGQVAYHGPVGAPGRNALWLGTPGGTVQNVARPGGQAPGTPAGVTFGDNISVPSLDAKGRVAFTANLAGPGVAAGNNSGIFTGAPGDLKLVARAGQPAPGIGGGVVMYATFSPVLNNVGQLVFQAALDGPGVNVSNDAAYVSYDPVGGLRLVAREGDRIEVAPGDVRTIRDGGLSFGDTNAYDAASGVDGNRTRLNDAGEFAFLLSIADPVNRGQQGIFVATIPQQGRVANGDFARGSLRGYDVTGPGRARAADLGGGNFAAELTAGSPVTLTQDVVTPADPFRLQFDYDFAGAAGTLDVLLGSQVVATLTGASSPQDGFATASLVVSDPSLLGQIDVPLSFRFDGTTGSQVLLDNVSIPEPAGAFLLGVAAATGLLARRRR